MFGKKYKNMAKISDMLQNFIMSNPKRAIEFMTSMPDSFWEKQGEKMALKTFHETAEKVPAYKDFLLKHGIKDHTKIKTIEDFKKYVPITDRRNYFEKYSPQERCIKDSKETPIAFYFSSGATGKPICIFQREKDMNVTIQGVITFFDWMWDILSARKVLYINSYALGVWIGGYMNFFVAQELKKKIKHFTYVSPGTDEERTLDIIESIGKDYDRILLTMYPSFLISLIEAGEKRGIKWHEFNIKILGGGEYLDDHLRKYFIETFDPVNKNPWLIYEGYGFTELGGSGGCSATPLAIKIREFCLEDKTLCKEIFKDENPAPLFQYNPLAPYFECINGEITATHSSYSPIVRYNVKDMGDIISFRKMEEILKTRGYNINEELKKNKWIKPNLRWPFLIFRGRKDEAITLLGAKISPSSVAFIFHRYPFVKSYKFSNYDERHFPSFMIFVELKETVKLTEKEILNFKTTCERKILDYLLKTNFDFKDAYSSNPKMLAPKIKVYESNTGPFKKKTTIKEKLV
jgi:phenylacetate-CoA ligase